MAKWIDENANSSLKDENKLFKYLYHLVNMQAHQLAFFNTLQDYDEFSLYCSSRLIIRLLQPRKTTDTIKSILNYIKKVIHHYKVDYEIEKHGEQPDNIISLCSSEISSYMMSDICAYDQVAYVSTSTDIVSSIMVHLKKLPKSKYDCEWNNICISCILTFIRNYSSAVKTKNDYRSIWNKEPVLYHLPDSMSNYIRILIVELKHLVSAELSYHNQVYISPEEVMKSIMCDMLEE